MKKILIILSFILIICVFFCGSFPVYAKDIVYSIAESSNCEISQNDDGTLRVKPTSTNAGMIFTDTFLFLDNVDGKVFPGTDRIIPEPMIMFQIEKSGDLDGYMAIKWEGHENYGWLIVRDIGGSDGISTTLRFSFWRGDIEYKSKDYEYTYGSKIFVRVAYANDVNRWEVIMEKANGLYTKCSNDWHAMNITLYTTNIADKTPRRAIVNFEKPCNGIDIKRAGINDVDLDVKVTLNPIYQSLDFGAYPIDFDGGAVIDDKEYEYGDNFDIVGVHNLVYTESDSKYRRDLVLYKLGDVNCDKQMNIIDLIALKKKLLDIRKLDAAGEKAADITLDGEISSDDLVMLRKNLMKENSFPETTYKSDDVGSLIDFTVDVESGRDIKVLQLTDTQIIESEQQRTDSRLGGVGSSQYNQWLSTKKDERYHNYLTQTIENYNPDFIIITGDLIYGEFDDSGEALLEFIDFMDSFKIPWAPIFGNHDSESYKGVDWQCEQLENSPYCLFKQRTLTGNGNYTVGLKQDGKYKRVFFMLDSNGCSGMSSKSFSNGHSKKEIGFGEDQIEWYTDLAEKMRYAEPDLKLSAAFHIQLSVFTKAYAKYGFVNSNTINNPINIDILENREKTDFGYIGRDLKGAWDTDETVWYSLKNSGFDSIYVGHEHCNSASVVYRGVRFQYGQKSSTYDRANYIDLNGNIVGSYSSTAGTPIVGGTSIPINQDGSLGIGELLLYKTPEVPVEPENPEEPVEIAHTETYDFNGTDFDTSESRTGVCASNFITSLISDTSVVPVGYTDRVYGRTNCGTDGYATFSAKFTDGIDTSNIVSLKVRMYVTSYTPTSGKKPLVRILSGTAIGTAVSAPTFESLGGVYDEWCEIDIWPLIKDTSLISDNTLTKFIMAFRFYTSDTTAKCYYDSLIVGFSQ